MSDEEETFQEDLEYQNTQKEIEELRRREEELMMKMNAIENKRKSVSDNSLDDKENIEKDETSENDDEEQEEIGKRRRPSLSRGSSKSSETSNYRPKSLDLENETGTFRSRSHRSSGSSPTKENRTSASSSRTSLTSPSKETIYSTRSTISIKQSGSPVKSPSSQGYRIQVSTSGASSPRKEEKANVSPRAKTTRSYSTSSSKKSPRNSDSNLSKSATNVKKSNRRSFPVADDSDEDIEMQSEEKSHSTTNLSKVEVPENKLSNREIRGSRDSSNEEKPKGSIKLNEDSYEIIEIDDEEVGLSPDEEKANMSAREKIEQELAEQKQREEELRMSQRLSSSSRNEGHFDEKEDYNNGIESTDDDEEVEDVIEENREEEDEKLTLSTWEKIALEIEEEKRREEEVSIKKKIEADLDSGEMEDNSASDEDSNADVSKRITQEIEDQKRRDKEMRKSTMGEEESISGEESNDEEKVKVLSVQDRIELEIKEIEKRESELKKIHPVDETDDIVEDDAEVVKSPLRETGAKSKIQLEIEEFKKKESEFRRLHGVDERIGSEDEYSDITRFSSMSVIERDLAEQKKKEQEYRRQHKQELKQDEEAELEEIEYDDDEIPEDESMLMERTERKTKGKIIKKSHTNEKSEFIVAPGITRKFIHMFDKGADKSVTKRKEVVKANAGKSEEKQRINGHKHKSNEDYAQEFESIDDTPDEEDIVDKEDDSNGTAFMKEGTEEEEEEEEEEEMKPKNNELHHGIEAPSPGKKLVLKRKKSRERKKEESHDEEIDERVSNGLKRNSAGDRSKVIDKIFPVFSID